jgi:hypothetical protein
MRICTSCYLADESAERVAGWRLGLELVRDDDMKDMRRKAAEKGGAVLLTDQREQKIGFYVFWVEHRTVSGGEVYCCKK